MIVMLINGITEMETPANSIRAGKADNNQWIVRSNVNAAQPIKTVFQLLHPFYQPKTVQILENRFEIKDPDKRLNKKIFNRERDLKIISQY